MTPTPTNPAARPATGVRLRMAASNVLVGVLFAIFAYAAFSNWRQTGHAQMLLMALLESLIVGLVITRNPSVDESRSPWDWAVALLGTCAPLLQRPGLALPALEPLGLTLQVAGALLAVVAVLSLGRSFGIVAANRGVRTAGFYRFVRHPLYGSYLVSYLGFLLGNLSPANVALIALTVACQYARAVAEERILLRDPAYQEYAARVRYRFIPYVF